MNISLLAIFGVTGVLLRYSITYIAELKFEQIHFGSAFSNILGCFLIGVFYSLYTKSQSHFYLPLMIGFCGGLTTFSSFTLEGLKLFELEQYGRLSIAFVIISVLCFCLTALGFYLTNLINK